MKKITFSGLGKHTFLSSFLLGTVILIIHYMTKDDFWFYLGFYYVITAVVINVLVFLYEILEYLGDISDKKANRNAALLLLLNIPITLLYLFIVFNL